MNHSFQRIPALKKYPWLIPMIRTFRNGLRTLPAQVSNFGGGADLDLPLNLHPLNRAISGRLNRERSHWWIQLTLNCGV